MANRTWTGATDGDWIKTANWAEAVVPINGDDVFIPSGSVDIDTNLNQSAVALASLRVGRGYSGKIGSAGTFLQIDATDVIHGGEGECFLDGTYTTVIVGGGIGDDSLHLKGDITTLRIEGRDVNGTITIENSAQLDDIEVQSANGAKLVIGTSVTKDGSLPINSLTMDSGQVEVSSAIVTEKVYGGLFTRKVGAVTTLEIEDTGVVKDQAAETIATLKAFGGRFDGTQNESASVTVTNAEVHEDAVIDTGSGLQNYVFTNGIDYHGGEVVPDVGQTITLA